MGDTMLEQPEVDLREAYGDVDQMVALCEVALLQTGKRGNQLEDYEKAVIAMKEEVKKSKAMIRTLAILAQYCKVIK